MQSSNLNDTLYRFNENIHSSTLSTCISERLIQAETIAIAGSRFQIEELDEKVIENYFRILRASIEEIRFLHEEFLKKIKSLSS